MKLEIQNLLCDHEGQELPLYMAQPAMVNSPLPAIIVIQEIFGVDDHIEDIVHRIATAGFTAVTPDLYALGGKRPDALTKERVSALRAFLKSLPIQSWMDPNARADALIDKPASERDAIEETLGILFSPTRDMEKYASEVASVVRWLANNNGPAVGKIGCTGFCFGGGVTALTACIEPLLSAAVIFYGHSPAPEKVSGINCPVLGLYGGEDARVNDSVPAFAEAMQKAGKNFEQHFYPGAPHAFFNDTNPTYRVDAARDGWARTLSFFTKHLV
ncbi:MAG: dienelactone hydrolase family protein [Actinobacteria bacterium]|nr:dienelactone hydrolase family protein [Actinomycetota bacterium]MCL6105227.1 dienelactone hydrolase family protein [Actinomycetota bacterium]